jgi:uncharacterized membrane protein YgcG
MLFALLGSGALSRSVEGFAWALIAYIVILIALVASEFRGWIRLGYLRRVDLSTILVYGGFAEALIAGALLVDASVERHPLALVVSVPALLILMMACDLTMAARIGRSERRATMELSPEEGAPRDDDEPQYGDSLQGDNQTTAIPDAPVQVTDVQVTDSDRAAAHGRCLRVLLDFGKLGVRGAGWIAPVAAIGVLGVGAVVAIGGVPRGVATSTTSRSSNRAGKSVSGGKSGGARISSGKGGSGGNGTAPAPWNGPCTEETRSGVSEIAFERMVSFFKMVRLEVGVEGCIEDLEGHVYPDDYYVTAVGAEQPTHEPLSFAIESERCGGALVLIAARKAVEEVIALAGPVCGVGPYPRYFVNKGDYYFLRSSVGVYIIFRKTETDEYEIMPPGLVRAWYHAMLAVNVWLWPSPPRRTGGGMLLYEMWSKRSTEHPEVTVTFNQHTGVGSYPGQSFPPDPKFEPLLGSLVNLAETA